MDKLSRDGQQDKTLVSLVHLHRAEGGTMFSARPGAGYITLNHRLFWKTHERDFWAVATLIIFIELDLASVMAKAIQISFVRYHQGHVPSAVTVHNKVIFMFYPNVHILMRKKRRIKK